MAIRIVVGASVAMAFCGVTAAACAPLKPPGAECSGLIYRQCIITDGSYAGIYTSMTYEQAFQVVCKNIRSQRFEPNPIIYSVDEIPNFYQGEFCDQSLETVRNDYWGLRQPGILRDVGMSLIFQEGVIMQINVGYRGWDP